MLLTVSDYEAMTKRTVPERAGRTNCARLDLGGSRAWSAALSDLPLMAESSVGRLRRGSLLWRIRKRAR